MKAELEYQQDPSTGPVTASLEAPPRRGERQPRPVRNFAEPDIATIVVGNRGRIEFGDLTGLMRSIDAIGLLHPITVAGETNLLLAGARRLEACRRLGWQTIPAIIVQVDELETRIKESCDGNER